MMQNIQRCISLDGTWEFYYSPEKFVPAWGTLPPREKFTGRMVTPGYWDDNYELFDEEDFFGRPARFNPDYRPLHFPMGTTLFPHACTSFLIGSGFYRKCVSAEIAEGERVMLTVGPAMWSSAVYCNGSFAGRNTSYSVAKEYDLTPFFKAGSENEIIVVVCNVNDDGGAFCRVDGSHAGSEFGTRPGQNRGLAAQGFQAERAGIGGGVSLRITGKSSIKECFITWESELPVWHVETVNSTGCMLFWSICDGEKNIAQGGIKCESDVFDFTTPVVPELWSDRDPKLYNCKVELVTPADAVVSDSRIWRWGARKVICDGPRIRVNGSCTYFRGATEHCYFPETCNPHFDYEKYLRDLGVLKNAGFNFIRCHTWCPPEPFYDACDTLGIYVQTELPTVYSTEEAEDIIRMIRKHTCAVIFCEGNEKKIHNVELERMRELAATVRRMAPGMLFNPQEAIRGVEYDFMPNREITTEPMCYDKLQFDRIAEFSDLYGSLGGGYFSYGHDLFPGAEEVDRMHAIYKKPCLSHEIGILGGFLDFSQEKRYENTFIGTGFFEASRKQMQRHGVYQYAEKYYKYNSLFMTQIRKQLIENLRACSTITGYDYLGGIDTHWHLFGYPCGVFNEFYEEKYGETVNDVRRYNGESVFICSAFNQRNRFAGSEFNEKILLSYFGRESVVSGTINWRLVLSGSDTLIAEGAQEFSAAEGTVSEAAQVCFTLPEAEIPYQVSLQVRAQLNDEFIDNAWEFYIFPAETPAVPCGVRIADKLTEKEIDFLEKGGSLLLTGGFPAATTDEAFRPHTSGRAQLHGGVLLNDHPVWRDFPHRGFMEWQFFNMMSESKAIVYDPDMPEYNVIMELIPSFKLVKRKSVLTEFRVGRGTLLICGLNLDEKDPAARCLKKELLNYLGAPEKAPAAAWEPDALRRRITQGIPANRAVVKVDAGGRPIEE